ncbi:hypothetical protein MSG28_009731 [Choristoneura fumiferana]|uniref:Uncharacterized protein n=1 Tax=Choristoneura fumiferana TaxID=7141 RepID=A0ACC0JCF1_CHOFU|nr:hypothetical protein MSG28_009731 [Choristoneura fumiferana]
MFIILGVVILAIILALAFAVYYSSEKQTVYTDLKDKHVVVTGGSSGIGKAAAEEAARLGAHVTIIGRDVSKLSSALDEIIKYRLNKDQKIQFASLDLTTDYNSIAKCLSDLEATVAPIFMLVNCAGMCICGIYGYSAYSGGKWAVRGLAESLFMELIGTGVRLTLAFPPDTDTPGLKNEDLTKPKETKLISSGGGLQSPESVAKTMIHDAMTGRKYSVFGLSGMMMSLLNCGSIDSLSQVLVQISCMGLLRTIMVGVLISFHKIVWDNLKEKKESIKNK